MSTKRILSVRFSPTWMNLLDFLPSRMYDEIMSVDAELLRAAMRQWATGVTIVSVAYKGIRHGMTVSSFTSLSLEPPLVMVSLEDITRTRDMMLQAGHFGVTILSQEQEEISALFAERRTEYQDRFAGLQTYTLKSESPLLAGGLVGFDCRIAAIYPAGNHTMFVGDLLAVHIVSSRLPLIYYDRNYRSLVL